MSFNYLMLEVSPAKELSVAEAVDRLVGVDSSYCPLYYEVKRISRHAKRRGNATKANPVIPRYIFITASFPCLGAVLAIPGALRFGLNNHFQPEIIPSWQMKEFQEIIEAIRLDALRRAERLERAYGKPEKPQVFKDFKAMAAHYKTKGQNVDPETGEISVMEAA